MKKSKLLIFILFSVLGYGLFSLYKHSGSVKNVKASDQSVVKLVADDTENTAYKRYKDSIINSYDADLSWLSDKDFEEYGTSSQPEIAGEAGVLVEINSGKVLFSKEINKRMKIASLAKIMTAVVALEHRSLDTRIYIEAEAASVGENSMGISETEVYTLEELMYGLMMNSGNDAAYATAKGVAGNVERFVQWMNFKASELGLANTYFADPSGLNDTTYSTPLDLVKLSRYAMKNPKIKNIVKTVIKELPGEEHKYIALENQTNLLTTYPGVAGIKTGYTEEAGLCLVTYASNGGKEVIGVVLKSVDRKGDMILMLDHGFRTLGVNVEHNLLE
ncbi:hypothetical protein A3F07_00075 [candidate division WWE3 bacterium RIFCSPHIGHO2_12_FULL_38_15]|uniref:Peptidase S11 D-alanyl-D-alanine carboxypeptidase A N-terminal domain-containing protein n=1 Tax=candidate division WWE3 bacterium RIFCSPHIGHO2_02_FULL_38_14 TaxID=1802620 RepID=A0A1F4V6V3_UNCKA|nr:MAG: hypothetical protein A2793_01125 [candidate division WWE3 bacterium RIFCSPHIGHO2_01_FULL_38_45]OGC49235.1 MAG: hypothetical protein A3F07_00075 [candidate division WWE3 bacterium RIFCSPHIGHO2_12_FULL_38_15]OGC52846.1 MAG: hypothetical protein A3D91_00480 [candidate division WWE3 bacterium RIFCSPHIGHO2_02_FULL_38_14]OGC54130.1 MAG: hypothetical protein A3B64_00340 [candidate division WWE3 bacterium RIFCSPLOWO2_01_FULL_37_24]HLB51325.1 D-alanyl-D-alanine carboxypeptidase family protein [P